MLYRVYSLDIEHYPAIFVLANLGHRDVFAQWLANPKPWNRSAPIDAQDLDDVFTKGNSPDVYQSVRSVSVGDVIEEHDTRECFMVTPVGFWRVGRPSGACPHAATLKPSQCEFCADEAM